MSDIKTAILLVNVGSPDAPTKKAVKRFLREFLNDGRVIDIPWFLRLLLVNIFIIPARIKNSTQLYKRLFEEKGSPLIFYSESLKNKLQQLVAPGNKVFLAMRYGNPGYKAALRQIKNENFQRLLVFPMFPQRAMSTTDTAIAAIKEEITNQNIKIQTAFVEQFYNHPLFIDALAKRAADIDLEKQDHVVFSFHGLPLRQVDKIHPEIKASDCNCNIQMPEHGKNCYRATCYQTARLLAEKLNLLPEQYTVSFQSRLSKNWLAPFTDNVLKQLATENKRKVVVFAPSFVSDCLETTIEIGVEYRKMFIESGGESLQQVPGLNDTDVWAEAVFRITKEAIIDNP